MSKNLKTFWPLIVILVGAVLAAVGVYYYSSENMSLDDMSAVISAVAHRPRSANSAPLSQSYVDNKVGFSFNYPKGVSYSVSQNIGTLKELEFSNGIYVFIADANSMAEGIKNCKTSEGECASFSPSCATDACHVYFHDIQAGRWSERYDFIVHGVTVEFLQPFDIKSPAPAGSLTDDLVNSLISRGKINPSDLKLFSAIVSSFTANPQAQK